MSEQGEPLKGGRSQRRGPVARLALQQYLRHLPSLRAHAACMQGLLPSDHARSGRETALYLKLSYRGLKHTIPDCALHIRRPASYGRRQHRHDAFPSLRATEKSQELSGCKASVRWVGIGVDNAGRSCGVGETIRWNTHSRKTVGIDRSPVGLYSLNIQPKGII